MLFGHHSGRAGVSYHNGWVSNEVNLVGTNWLLSTDSQYVYRANGVNMATQGATVGSTYLPAFGINQLEASDFFYADCIIFNSVLTNEQMVDMENYLTQLYGLRQDGVIFKIYANYHNESPTYDSTASIRSSSNCVGLITNMTNVNTGTNGFQGVNGADNYSVFWSGYLLSDFTGTWTFGLAADDGAYLWIGDFAQSGYTVANCNINNGGGHGVQNVTCTVNLIYGKYYPIRYFFGEMGGGDDCQLYFSRNGSANNYNFSGYFYQQRYSDGYGYKIENAIVSAPSIAPSGISATSTGSSVTLSFNTVARATSYSASTSPGGFTGTSTGSPLTITGLAASTSYTITIFGLNAGGNGPSATFTFSTTAAAAVTVSGTGAYTFSTVGAYSVHRWTGSGTATFSSSKTAYFFIVGGGASGGGSCNSGNSSPGGGSGGGVYYNRTNPVAFTGGTAYTITVGGGGSPAARTINGSAGGTTSIVGTGVSISVAGGNGGTAPTGDGSGAAGGGAVSSGSGGGTGAVIATSGAGGNGARGAGGGVGGTGPNPNITEIGFTSIVSSGGGGGVGGPYNAPGSPGTASGGGSGTSVIDSNGVAATWYGCGGGGALGDGRDGFGRPGYTSGAGAPGVVYIWFQ
jgi:hypothetical protein